jgi:hypothetical protein
LVQTAATTLGKYAANVARARLYVAGLGYFLPFLDGAQLGEGLVQLGEVCRGHALEFIGAQR